MLDGCVCILSYSPASHRGYIGPGSTFFRWALDLPRRPPQFTTHNHPPGHVTVLNKYNPWPLSITPFPSSIAPGTNRALLKATPGLWCMIIYRRRRLCYLGISQPQTQTRKPQRQRRQRHWKQPTTTTAIGTTTTTASALLPSPPPLQSGSAAVACVICSASARFFSEAVCGLHGRWQA